MNEDYSSMVEMIFMTVSKVLVWGLAFLCVVVALSWITTRCSENCTEGPVWEDLFKDDKIYSETEKCDSRPVSGCLNAIPGHGLNLNPIRSPHEFSPRSA